MGMAACSTSTTPVFNPECDVRDEFGKWIAAEATPSPSREKPGLVKVHFVGWDPKWDATLDKYVDQDHFAERDLYSRKPSRNTTKFSRGEKVRIKMMKPRPSIAKWIYAVVLRIDGDQVKTQYYDKGIKYQYWYHVRHDPPEIKHGNDDRPQRNQTATSPQRKQTSSNAHTPKIQTRTNTPPPPKDESDTDYEAARSESLHSERKRGYKSRTQRPQRSQQRRSDEDHEDRGFGFYSRRTYSHREAEYNSKALAAKSSSSSPSGNKPCCDACNGPHETKTCPVYKKPRPKHKDAWVNKGRRTPLAMGSSGGNVKTRNAQVVSQPGDGNCLFHSLAYGLGSNANRVRQEVCRFLLRNPKLEIGGDTIHEWIEYDSNCSVRTYVSKMSRSGVWGGGIEIAACAHLYGVNVHVWERSWGVYKRISCFEVKGARKVINVIYGGRMHYDALIVR
ncbi:hypothetical protein AAMO2058_000138900 [Amorphochlora amoebiformis]|eukprot:265082-Amorphochlora_amoeboformis.AAC.1